MKFGVRAETIKNKNTNLRVTIKFCDLTGIYL